MFEALLTAKLKKDYNLHMNAFSRFYHQGKW